MTNLLQVRDIIVKILEKYEALVTPVCKFLLAFTALLSINGKIGYQSTLASPLLALILALFCALIPMNFTAGILAVYIIVQMYSLTMEAALVALILFMLIFLLYFRFSPKDTVLLLLMPLCSLLKIPYLIPFLGGLLFTPASAVTAGVAILASSFVNFVAENEASVGQAAEDQEMLDKFRLLIDGIVQNRGMMVLIAAFAVSTIVIYFIRRQRIAHAWSIAVGAGALTQLAILLIGSMAYDTDLSAAGIFLGTIFSALIAEVIVFFLFNLDYSRTEEVQFEDDDYYYYVKAVPKLSVASPERKVKTINHSREGAGRPSGKRPRPKREERIAEDGYNDSGAYYDEDLEMLEDEDNFEYYDDEN